MTVINSYATLAEFKAWKEITNSDATRDGVVNDILESASRYIDSASMRTFFPRIETRYYDVPAGRELCLDDDLLEVLTITNGDNASLPSTEYNLLPKNLTPHYAIKITPTSTYYWTVDTTSGNELVIDINGIWGYHNRYSQRAWKSVGTLGAAVTDTTTLAFTMTAGHTVLAGQILKIGSELYNVNTVSSNTITPFVRGDNGSTAATHLISTAVYAWQPMDDIKEACLDIAHNIYSRRFGGAVSQNAIITGAGVVLTQRDIPEKAKATINAYTKKY